MVHRYTLILTNVVWPGQIICLSPCCQYNWFHVFTLLIMLPELICVSSPGSCFLFDSPPVTEEHYTVPQHGIDTVHNTVHRHCSTYFSWNINLAAVSTLQKLLANNKYIFMQLYKFTIISNSIIEAGFPPVGVYSACIYVLTFLRKFLFGKCLHKKQILLTVSST